MSKEEILEKAIQKAIDGGWQPIPDWEVYTPHKIIEWYEVGSLSTNFDNYKLFIFDHDFARALWGDGEPKYRIDNLLDWQYHLQQMVIADDPLQYLGDNI